MRDVYAHVKVSWKVYGVLDTVEKKDTSSFSPRADFAAQRIMRESSLVMGIGGN